MPDRLVLFRVVGGRSCFAARANHLEVEMFKGRSKKKRVNLLEGLERREMLATNLFITEGGTYTGTFESMNPDVPAVLVDTTEPVIIQNATIRGRGDLIKSGTNHTNITVRNVN